MSAEYLLLKLCTGCEGGRCVGGWALGSILSRREAGWSVPCGRGLCTVALACGGWAGTHVPIGKGL